MATVNLGAIKFNFRGAYAGGTAYVGDDVVTSGGSSYVCILASTGNAVSNGTYWSLMAQAGTNGSNGTDVGLGTAGQVLKTNSGASAIEWGTAGGGGMWTAGSSGTFSGASSAAWTGLTETTRIFITNYEKSASTYVRMRTSSDGGSSYDSSANSYSSTLYGIKGSSSTLYTDVRQNSITSVQIDGADSAGGTSAADDIVIDIIIWNPQDATKRTFFTWSYYGSLDSSAYTDIQHGIGHRSATHAVNAFQIHGGGTNSGSYTIYTLS